MSNGSVYKKIIKISNEEMSKYIPDEDCQIFHYTSPVGLNGILTNNALRFTDRNYLNDYSEGRYVLELCLKSRFELSLPKKYRDFYRKTCKRLYNNLSVKKRHVYQCSFSLDKDNLSLWNYYTKNDGVKGYNIGFNSNELKESLILNDKIPQNHGIKVFGGKVIYNVRKQKEIVKNIVNDFSTVIQENIDNDNCCRIAIEVLFEKILQVGAFFKSNCFKNEKEFRLVIFFVAVWDEKTKSVKFMLLNKRATTYEKNGLLIPYVDIEFKTNVLREIVISPTLSFEEICGNIKNALKLHSYNENQIQISKSNIPVRY